MKWEKVTSTILEQIKKDQIPFFNKTMQDTKIGWILNYLSNEDLKIRFTTLSFFDKNIQYKNKRIKD